MDLTKKLAAMSAAANAPKSKRAKKAAKRATRDLRSTLRQTLNRKAREEEEAQRRLRQAEAIKRWSPADSPILANVLKIRRIKCACCGSKYESPIGLFARRLQYEGAGASRANPINHYAQVRDFLPGLPWEKSYEHQTINACQQCIATDLDEVPSPPVFRKPIPGNRLPSGGTAPVATERHTRLVSITQPGSPLNGADRDLRADAPVVSEPAIPLSSSLHLYVDRPTRRALRDLLWNQTTETVDDDHE